MESIDFSSIPVKALKPSTRSKLSLMLNPRMILMCEQGFHRDWRGVAELAGFDSEIIANFALASDSTEALLGQWCDKKPLSVLLSILCQIDRFDVIDDSRQMLDRDAVAYMVALRNKEQTSNPNTASVGQESEEQLLVIGDSLGKQTFDAFLLYADEDIEFAEEMVRRLEEDSGMKLCLKDRDLLPGLAFEHEGLMRLIKDRCRRVIIILSPSFFSGPVNNFLTMFTQALSVEQRRRILVPCVYRPCTLPTYLTFCSRLDYTRATGFWSFWDKVKESLVAAPLHKQMTTSYVDGLHQKPTSDEASVLTSNTASICEPSNGKIHCDSSVRENSSSPLSAAKRSSLFQKISKRLMKRPETDANVKDKDIAMESSSLINESTCDADVSKADTSVSEENACNDKLATLNDLDREDSGVCLTAADSGLSQLLPSDPHRIKSSHSFFKTKKKKHHKKHTVKLLS